MESFELVLVLLACVIIAAVAERVIRRVSLPLVQIVVGLVAALVVPHVAEVHIDSELFLVLFIAPLLFNEARESSKRELWNNLPSILSLAIGLVLITVLVVCAHIPLALLSMSHFLGIWRIGTGDISWEAAEHHSPVWLEKDVIRTNIEK